MTSMALSGFNGSKIEEDLFGGNIIFNRGKLEGDGQYLDAIKDLGISGLRYPGGSVTEYYFDINDPDRPEGAHSVTGEVKSLIPLSDFMQFAEDSGREVTIVIPTRHYISDEADENGDRFADVTETDIRQFVKDVVSGAYGDGAVRAFEIGNEYWHSGDMNSVEYGRVAADMVNIVDDELSKLSADYPVADDIDIVVQMGTNYGTGNMEELSGSDDPAETIAYFQETYDLSSTKHAIWSDGGVNFHNISNQMILDELKGDAALQNVDGVAAHVYSYQTDFSRIFALQQVQQTWVNEKPDIEIYATEWNQKGVTNRLDGEEDYGLKQAHEMIKLVETFVEYGVDAAHVWPLIQRTDNALNDGFSYDDPNVPGEMFRMMSENLAGKRVLDFAGEDGHSAAAQFDHYAVHGFADPSDLILYVAAEHNEGVLDVDLDIGSLVEGYEHAEVRILGVAENENPFDSASTAQIETLDPEMALSDGFLDVPLDPGEIIQVVLYDYVPTDELRALFTSHDGDVEAPVLGYDDDGDFDLPVVPVSEQSEEDPSEQYEAQSDLDDLNDGMAGLGWLLALLPLGLLLGLG